MGVCVKLEKGEENGKLGKRNYKEVSSFCSMNASCLPYLLKKERMPLASVLVTAKSAAAAVPRQDHNLLLVMTHTRTLSSSLSRPVNHSGPPNLAPLSLPSTPKMKPFLFLT